MLWLLFEIDLLIGSQQLLINRFEKVVEVVVLFDDYACQAGLRVYARLSIGFPL